MHRSAPVVLALCAAVLGGCSAPPTAAVAPRALPIVPTVVASRGTLAPQTTLGGIVAPEQIVGLQSMLVEPVASVAVQEGDVVRAGTVLATLDVSDLRANLEALTGTAAAASARVRQNTVQAGLTIEQNANAILTAQAAKASADATLDRDRRNVDRLGGLFTQGYVSAQAVDTARTLVLSDRQALRAADVALASARAQVSANGSLTTGLQGATVAVARGDAQAAAGSAEQLRAQIAKATIVAPIDAVVVNRNVNPGEYPGTKTLFVLHAVDREFAVLNGSATQVASIRTGAPATIVLASGHTSLGRVVGVLSPVTPGATNFVVKVALRGDPAVRPGDVVSGRIALPTHAGVRVPVAAFVDDTHAAVQVVEGKRVRTVRVRERAEEGGLAIVDGLAAGSVVVGNGQAGLRDGQTVAIARTQAAAS